MPDFIDGAFSHLQGWYNTFRTDYAPGVANFMKRHGRTTRIMPMKTVRLEGNRREYEVKAFVNRGTRVSMDLMAPSPDPNPGAYIRFNVNFDETDPVINDFAAFEVGFRTTIWSIWKRGDRTWKDSPDFIRKDVMEGLADVKETFAKYLHLNSEGLLGTILSIRDDDAVNFADATNPYTAGSTTALLQLNNTAIARIGDGQLLDFYNATTDVLIVSEVRVTYLHPQEQTLAVELTADSVDAADATVVNLNGLGATNEIFLSGNRGQAPRGTLSALFDATQAYYGLGRLPGQTGQTYAAINRVLIPIIHAAAGAALTGEMFREIGETVGWQQGGFDQVAKKAVVMSRFEYREVARIAKNEGITFTPALESEIGRKLNKAFGFDGFILHDPNLGSVMIIVDDFAEPGQIDFLNMAQWEIVNPIDGGFRMLPGAIAGIWNRMSESDGTGRLSKRYEAQGIQVAAFVCKWPKGQLRLSGLQVNA